jgi:hypothetical protein
MLSHDKGKLSLKKRNKRPKKTNLKKRKQQKKYLTTKITKGKVITTFSFIQSNVVS